MQGPVFVEVGKGWDLRKWNGRCHIGGMLGGEGAKSVGAVGLWYSVDKVGCEEAGRGHAVVLLRHRCLTMGRSVLWQGSGTQE